MDGDEGAQDLHESVTRKGDWIETFTGRAFYPMDPRAEDVEIVDIAHALSMIPRFGGHSQGFYSVAAHSLHVERMAMRCYPSEADKKALLYCLLHDAAEAYIGDMVRPLKRSMPDFVEVEARILDCVMERFGLSLADKPDYLNSIDNMALASEARALVRSQGIKWKLGVVPDTAKIMEDSPLRFKNSFLERFRALSEK